MGNRWYVLFVALFWLASMSWLMVAKVLPPLAGGQAPDYRAALAEAPRQPAPVAWRLVWEDQAIGYAVTRVRPAAGGGSEMRSLVRFEQLDVKKVLEQLLGAFARVIPSLGNEELRLELTVASRLGFDQDQMLKDLDTSIAVADMPHVLNLKGEVRERHTLDVMVFSGHHVPDMAGENQGGVIRHRLDLPRDALVGDAFAPNSQLKNLQVGQTWTIPVYRPFPPNSPVQIIEAKAERLELIYWNREPMEAMVVAYRDEAGSGIGAARRPIGRVWVRPDGMVLRQEVVVSNLRLLFERLTEEEGTKYGARLEDAEFLRLLPRESSQNQDRNNPE
jgi:hypothetical protein